MGQSANKLALCPFSSLIPPTAEAFTEQSSFRSSRIPETLELSDGVWSLNVEPLNFELP